jgi:NAD(P)-dependent dehydrogenase (short-subunit alcohol dehydrogenase family)
MRESVHPTHDFTGQVAFITGASSGDGGPAAARAFSEADAAVALTDIDEDPSTRWRRNHRRRHQAPGLVCDVSHEDQVAAAVDRTVKASGRLDMAYNAAGIMPPPTGAADESAAQFDRVQSVDLRGIRASMKHELRHRRDQGAGAIVNCSSLGSFVGNPGRAAYHATGPRRDRPDRKHRPRIRASRRPRQRRVPRPSPHPWWTP